jgi:hypothetical protein
MGYKNDGEWLATHSNDAVGFRKWCEDLDTKYAKEDKEYFQDKIPKAPCHGEFYKWTQWHNLVHEGLDLIPHQVPILTIYYEDYTSSSTAKAILEFLELEQVGEIREFTARSDYDGYFTPKEVDEIKKLVKDVADEKTWAEVKHYFEDDKKKRGCGWG